MVRVQVQRGGCPRGSCGFPSRLLDVPFEPEDLYLTTGGFTAIALALKAVADPGDEVIYSLPPWFLYEPLVVEAGLVPVKVRIDLDTFDLDLAAIEAAITERTRVVIINSPNNPTGRIYPPELLRQLATLLDDASARIGRRIYLVSDEPYNRIVFDGARFHSPAEFYPYTLLAYSYGKTHLAPGERIGYLALPPSMPDRKELGTAIEAMQLAMGWIYPNAVLQYALPRLETFTIDVGQLQQKRDRLVQELGGMGYRLRPAEGTFYLFIHSPIRDDEAFTEALAKRTSSCSRASCSRPRDFSGFPSRPARTWWGAACPISGRPSNGPGRTAPRTPKSSSLPGLIPVIPASPRQLP